MENGVNSYYNALAVQVRKRFSHGLQAHLAWTWAHEIDYKQGTYQDNYGFSTIDSFANLYNGDYKADKGSGLLDQRHRVTINFVEQPRFTHRDGAFYRYAVNNWQLSGIVTLASGRPDTAGSDGFRQHSVRRRGVHEHPERVRRQQPPAVLGAGRGLHAAGTSAGRAHLAKSCRSPSASSSR